MPDDRLRPELQRPAEILQPPGEIGVLGGPDPLDVAGGLLEGGPADEQVGTRCPRAELVANVRALAQEVPTGAVSSGERARAVDTADISRDRSDSLSDRLGKERR